MTGFIYHPLGNGLGTDHPIPGLPFVDDAHIPDDPTAIEAIGRHDGGATWGREDNLREAGWSAFTTDPHRNDLAWCVRWHPEHGRSVVLFADDEAARVHDHWTWESPTALLFRAGGYWWNGTAWHRPAQIWDGAFEQYVPRPVPGATTVTAADILDRDADASRARVLNVHDLSSAGISAERWSDDLALWAKQRRRQRDLDQCLVDFAAPELNADNLVGPGTLAWLGEVDDNALRRELAAGEVPLPQGSIEGQPAWALAVAEEWAEKQRRSDRGLIAAVAVDLFGGSVPAGTAELWSRFSDSFFERLRHDPAARRGLLPWPRSDRAVRGVAQGLGWLVAGHVADIVPTEQLAVTLELALLREFATGLDLQRPAGTGQPAPASFGFLPHVGTMLDWLVRHDPPAARRTICSVIGKAEWDLGIPRAVSIRSIRTALTLDGKLGDEALATYLDRVLPT